ncbi:MAG TPA: TetR/AcrR family transcriptional regulator [Clostridiales bacterium]|nr:TetR/AcrR family transcriptional regulator [Clostridiales bacterium]
MPKETFSNLPEAKRRRIIDAALDEFSADSYGRASLTRIARQAGIAKGSMYQYFEDKFALYCYLFRLAGERKLAFISEAIQALGPDPDFFAILKAAIVGGFRLAREDPRLLALGNRFVLDMDPGWREKVMAHLGIKGESTIEEWAREGVRRGEIDPRIKPSTAARLIWAASESVGQELAAGKLSPDQAETEFTELIDVLERGLRPRSPKKGEKNR